MKKSTIATLILVAVLLIANCITFAFGAGTTPGSASDPVVTKSYVDSLYKELQAQIAAGTGAAISTPAQTSSPASTGSSSSSDDDTFIVLRILEGESLIGEGGTEIILRTGVASAIGANGVGVCDVTSGKDLKDGENIEKNHLLIVPRTDGRGIKCSKAAYVMVKGAYTIQ